MYNSQYIAQMTLGTSSKPSKGTIPKFTQSGSLVGKRFGFRFGFISFWTTGQDKRGPKRTQPRSRPATDHARPQYFLQPPWTYFDQRIRFCLQFANFGHEKLLHLSAYFKLGSFRKELITQAIKYSSYFLGYKHFVARTLKVQYDDSNIAWKGK